MGRVHGYSILGWEFKLMGHDEHVPLVGRFGRCARSVRAYFG